MTISTLAKLNKDNGGFFFNRNTMKGNGETLRSFVIVSQDENRLVLRRKNNTNGLCWNFDKSTGRLCYPSLDKSLL